MSWQRRWVIHDREKLRVVAAAIASFGTIADLARHPVEIVLRPRRVEKTGDQRALFHAICGDLAPHLGLEPRSAKLLVKARFYGVEAVDHDGVVVALVPSSEDSDREEYSRLIDYAYQMAAEAGVAIPDRRPK